MWFIIVAVSLRSCEVVPEKCVDNLSLPSSAVSTINLIKQLILALSQAENRVMGMKFRNDVGSPLLERKMGNNQQIG